MTLIDPKGGVGFAKGERLRSSQMTTIATQQPDAVDGRLGSEGVPYTPTSVVEINGSGFKSDAIQDSTIATGQTLGADGGILIKSTAGTDSRLRLTSRSVEFFQSISTGVEVIGTADYSHTPEKWTFVTDPAEIIIPLDLPDGQIIQKITIRIDPAGGHGGLPGTFPAFGLHRIDLDGVRTLVKSVVDSQGSVPSYEAAHDILLDTIAHTIDRTIYRYHVQIDNEQGANFVANMVMTSLKTSIDCTSIPEYGG